jgi:hypothetical protein
MRTLIVIATAALAVACAANSGVQPLHGDVLYVTHRGATGASSPTKLRREAIAEAEAYCIASDRKMEVVEIVENRPPFILGNFPQAEIRFRCLAEPVEQRAPAS